MHTVPYDSTTVLQNNLRHTDITGFTENEYTLNDIDGQKVVLRGRSDEVAAVTDARLPRAVFGLQVIPLPAGLSPSPAASGAGRRRPRSAASRPGCACT